MGFNLPVLNRRRRLLGTATPIFSPATLFTLSEPGIWLDPSDVANLAWRRNLLTWTEQFDNAAWSKLGTAPTVTANNTTDPLGGNTADRIAFAASGIANRVSQSLSTASGAVSITLSIWLRGSVGGEVLQVSDGWTNSSNFTLTTSWQRFTATMTGNTGSTAFMLFAQTGTPTVFAWGAQLELGSTATEYQRITDVNTEVIERFPSATLYQDTAGTIPVTGPTKPDGTPVTVALALDKSKGLVLGPELVTNGDFSAGSTGWTGAGATQISVISGELKVTNSSSTTSLAVQAVTTVVGRWYRFTCICRREAGNVSGLRATNNSDGTSSANAVAAATVSTSNTPLTLQFLATATTTYVVGVAGTDGSVIPSAFFDNISVKELPGFHATQATTASRPIYGINPVGGRRNLLTRTEEFDTSAWVKRGATITPNVVVAPNGTTTADTLVEDSATAVHDFYNAAPGLTVSAGTYVASVYVKPRGRTFVRFILAAAGSTDGATFNLVTGAATNVASGYTASSSLDPSGFWRLSVSASFASVALFVDFQSSDGTTTSLAGLNAAAFDVWGAQLETGSTATAYQRVSSQYDVTEAGVASVSYLAFDGVDDFLVTPTITPGIDKAQVFAGVRKLSDAAVGVIAELGTNAGAGSGEFGLYGAFPANGYTFRSRGTSTVDAASPTTFPSPITNVVSGLGDIAGDRSTLRINGVQAAQNTSDQGSGNYTALALYIGRRGGSSLPFNGQLYSLIVRFGTNLTTDTITSTETWVNGKTGAYA